MLEMQEMIATGPETIKILITDRKAQAVGAAVGRDFTLSEMDAHLPSSACLDASLHRLRGQQSYETALTDLARRTER